MELLGTKGALFRVRMAEQKDGGVFARWSGSASRVSTAFFYGTSDSLP